MAQWIDIEIDGEFISVLAQKINGVTWIHYRGKTIIFELENKKRRGGATQGSDDPNTILSPMPGKILKAMVRVGDTVEKGTTLIAMEAMKMEYKLESSIAAKVVELNCQDGDQVTKDFVLVRLESV